VTRHDQEDTYQKYSNYSHTQVNLSCLSLSQVEFAYTWIIAGITSERSSTFEIAKY
jgi:hypothetical protein